MKTELLLLFALGIIHMCSFINAHVGEVCVLKGTKQHGTCIIISQCPFVSNQAKLGINATLCGFQEQVIPIVCCPDNNSRASTTTNISEEKCEEYGRLISKRYHLISLDALNSTLLNVSKFTDDLGPLAVGGERAEIGEFPFMALVGFNTTDSPWKCGGTLINERYVLTAAHCTSWFNLSPTKVRLGELNVSTNDDGEHMDYQVSSITVHPAYEWPKKYNDIALLQTQTTVLFTKFIQPACLATNSFSETENPLAIGWGKTGYAEPFSDELLKVYLHVFDNAVCNRYYKIQDELPDGIISSMLCVGEPLNSTKRRDTCPGDSGGPLLVTKNNVRKFYVIGITSFGKPCGVSKIPAIYTRVSDFIPWIEKQQHKSKCT